MVQQGRQVRVLVRNTSNTSALKDLPVEICYGDVLDPASLCTAMEGCGSVFYSVVDPRFWLTDTTPLYRNNVEGLVNAMDAALLAEEHGRAGQRYIIANEFISNRDFYGIAAAERGNKPPKVIPFAVAYGVVWIVEHIFKLLRRRDYVASTDAVYLSNAFQAMDNSKARRELHWNPRPIAETIRDSVAWFAEREKN